MAFDPTYADVSCATLVSNSHGNTSKYVDTVTIFQKLNTKVNDHKMTFDPTSVEVTCVTLHTDTLRTEWVITQSLSEQSLG